MKKLFITILLTIFTFSITAQKKLKFIDSITYSQTEKLLGRKNLKNIVELNAYKTKSGDWIKVGDTLEIGRPFNKNNNNVSNISGTRFSTNEHSHIFLGTVGAMLMGTAMHGNENLIGDKIFITKLLMSRANKKNPYQVSIEFNKVGGGRFFNIKRLGRAILENALRASEIINGNSSLTRKEAIAKLKEQKDLLDLGMVSQEEFNALRKELTPIIMNKN